MAYSQGHLSFASYQGGRDLCGEALLAVVEVREPVHLPVSATPPQPLARLRRLSRGGGEEGEGTPTSRDASV